MNNYITEARRIEDRLEELRRDYLVATPARKKFIVVLGKSLKDKLKKLKEEQNG